MSPANVILIGMPGAGKSTLGVLLAKELGFKFLDTDLEIQRAEGRLLQEIVDQEGSNRLREIESEVCSNLTGTQQVIATGGSVVYSPAAMEALAEIGLLVWLDVPYPEIEKRIKNFSTRGLAKKPGQTLQDLFNERAPLYQKYSQLRIDCQNLSPEEAVQLIQKKLTPQ